MLLQPNQRERESGNIVKVQLQRQWHRLRSKVQFWFCRWRLQQVSAWNSPEYRQYLEIQLRRTLSKKNTPLPVRAMKLIDRTAELVDLGQCDVLCVGCRNVAELDYFRRKGVRNVIGIDLFSESQDILVMDMHHMSFPDNYFDVIYSSHSLEHAYDVRQAINEMVRVAHSGTLIVVEVPVRYDTKYIGTDLVDFGSLDNLHQYFNPYLEQVLWSETIQVGAFDCELGTDAIATVFRLIKPRSTYRVDATAIIESRIAEDKTCT